MADFDLTEERTDEELACAARAGSDRSFEELARRYKRRLFVYLRPRLGSDEDAEDMVQETLLKLYRNIGNFDPRYRFSTWLYTSAGRLAIDSYRRGAAVRDKMVAMEGGDVPDPAARPEGAGEESGIWEAARALGETRFRVLWLRYGEDMTIEEIAAVLRRTKLAVRVLLHRARTSLVERLGPAARCAAGPRPEAAPGTAGD
jgi:RNA polymerase sigma-70 factor (ECF subfamily)